MSAITIAGDTSGSVTLDAPAVAGTTVLTLPATSGTVMVNGPAFSAYLGAAQNITNVTDTVILFDNENFDTNSNYSTANGRFTPTVAGYYQVNANVALLGNTITLASANIRKNTNIMAFVGTTAFAFNSTPVRMSGSVLIYCNGTTDYIDVTGYVAAASGWQVGATSTFTASLVRGA